MASASEMLWGEKNWLACGFACTNVCRRRNAKSMFPAVNAFWSSADTFGFNARASDERVTSAGSPFADADGNAGVEGFDEHAIKTTPEQKVINLVRIESHLGVFSLCDLEATRRTEHGCTRKSGIFSDFSPYLYGYG